METSTRNAFLLNGQKISQLTGELKRKRPKKTRLDIEKLFQQSIQLTQIHKTLTRQNQILQKQHQKVELHKSSRQNFISAVEQLVKEKAEEVSMRGNSQSSWLVLNLNKKIYDLKNKINQKDNTIKTLQLTKQNQQLWRQEMRLDCFKQILIHFQEDSLKEVEEIDDILNEKKQIFWIDSYLEQEKIRLMELQIMLQQEEREIRLIMGELATKKAQLKSIKQMEDEYVQAQQSYQEQKKRKQATLVGKKAFINDLIKKKEIEQSKLESLKYKYEIIHEQENSEITRLQAELQKLETIYEEVNREEKNISLLKSTRKILPKRKQQWVKRVTIDEVQSIAKHMNYSLSLKKVSQKNWISTFFSDRKSTYSLTELIKKFSQQPFSWNNENEKIMISRYAIEDSDFGPIALDMERTQKTPIIKSILGKLIGESIIYSQDQISDFYENLGEKLSKFGSLIKQGIQNKELGKQYISREQLEEGIQNAQLQINGDEIDFILLYLFSWARDLEKLEISKIKKLKELKVKWMIQM